MKTTKLSRKYLRSSKNAIESILEWDVQSDREVAKDFLNGTYAGAEKRSFLSILSVIRRYRGTYNRQATAPRTIKRVQHDSSYAC